MPRDAPLRLVSFFALKIQDINNDVEHARQHATNGYVAVYCKQPSLRATAHDCNHRDHSGNTHPKAGQTTQISPSDERQQWPGTFVSQRAKGLGAPTLS